LKNWVIYGLFRHNSWKGQLGDFGLKSGEAAEILPKNA
jgi:hypothetical protein